MTLKTQNQQMRLTKKELQEYREKVSLLKKFVNRRRAESPDAYKDAVREALEELNKKGFRLNFNDIKDFSWYCYTMRRNERPREGYLRLVGRIYLLKNLFSRAKLILKKYTYNSNVLKNSQTFRNQVDDVYSQIIKLDVMKKLLA